MASNITVNYGGGVTANVANQTSITVASIDNVLNLSLPGQVSDIVPAGGVGNTYFAVDYVVANYSV